MYDVRTSDHYGNQFREFDWCYAVDALPRPSTSLWTRRYGYSDQAIGGFIEGVLRDLERSQGNTIYHAHVFESGNLGMRHVHALLGNISRLSARDVQDIFRNNGFGDTNVKLWNPELHSGYYFKSLDRGNQGHGSVNWDFNVVWNRKCRQRMRLNRRHLDKKLLARHQMTPPPVQ